MPYLEIDEPYRSALVKIADLHDDEFAQLRSALPNLPRTTNPTRLLSMISPRVGKIAKSTLEGILDTLLYFHSLASSSGVSLQTFVADISNSMERGGANAVVINEAKRPSFEKKLEALLSIDSLRLASKARDLAFDYPRIFQSVRILTDMRPVFNAGREPAIEGALVDHTLKIAYYADEGSREIYLALDSEDIKSIRKALDRADKKAALLRALFARNQIPNLDEDEEKKP